MRIAFLFAGQGAQYTGMGQELAEHSAAARAVFAAADAVRPGTSEQCFSASKQELSRTVNTQPCVFATDLAAARALTENGVVPDAVAGFSLGELAALTFAGAWSDEDGFRLVMRRAERMQAQAMRVPAGMAAILGLAAPHVEALCAECGVYAVNYNCPGQVTVAGEQTALRAFCLKVAQTGGKAVPLAVNGGFHSPLMEEAAKGFETDLSDYMMKQPAYPVYANLTGLPYTPPFAPTLARQAASPVLWQKTIETLLAGGTDTFIEVGPGKTLCGFMKKIAPEIRAVYNVQDRASLSETLTALRAGGTDA